jgi:gas vesicle protein
MRVVDREKIQRKR